MKKVLLIGGGAIGLLVCVCLAVAVASNSGTKKTEDTKAASSPVVQAQAVVTAALGATEKATPTPKPPPPTATPLPGIGSTAKKGNWEITLDRTERADTLESAFGGDAATPQGKFLIVLITAKNIGKQSYPLNSWDFNVYKGTVKYTTAAPFGPKETPGYKDVALTNVQPDLSQKMRAIFDVPPDANGLQVDIQGIRFAIPD